MRIVLIYLPVRAVSTAPRLARRAAAAAALAATAVLTACATDDVTAPPPAARGTLAVDASTRWVYVSLREGREVTPTGAATESSAWDVAFFATNVTLNGGAAGPGGVTGWCLCQNSATSPTAAQWLAMTPASEQGDFDAVTSVPASAAFTADVLTPAITGWASGAGAAAAATPDSAYLVRLADSSGVAKLRVTRLDAPTAAHAGRVTVEWAVARNGEAGFPATRTATLDLATGARRLDLDTGAPTTSATDWEVAFDGWTVRVNGGPSGPGKAAAARLAAGTFATATPASIAANAYRSDVYAGVFGTARWYRYNLGGDNRITPTHDVYLIRRGGTVWKLQLVNYYDATGKARVYTIRFAPLAS